MCFDKIVKNRLHRFKVGRVGDFLKCFVILLNMLLLQTTKIQFY